MDNNNKWDELSLTEKSEVMRQAVANGITNLNEIRQTYNEYADGGSMDNPPNQLPEVEVTAQYPYEQRVIDTMNNSSPEFLERLRNNDRRSIHNPDGTSSTHVLGSADNIVFPEIMDVNGKLVDNRSMPWQSAMRYAIKNNDYIEFPTEGDARYFGEHYKKYYPEFFNHFGDNQYAEGGPKGRRGTTPTRTPIGGNRFRLSDTDEESSMSSEEITEYNRKLEEKNAEIARQDAERRARDLEEARRNGTLKHTSFDKTLEAIGEADRKMHQSAMKSHSFDRLRRAQDSLSQGVNTEIATAKGIANASQQYANEQMEKKQQQMHDIKKGFDAAATLGEWGAAGYTIGRMTVPRLLSNNTGVMGKLADFFTNSNAQLGANAIGSLADGYQLLTADNKFDKYENGIELGGDTAGVIGGLDIVRNSNIFGRYSKPIDTALDVTGLSAASWDILKNIPPFKYYYGKLKDYVNGTNETEDANQYSSGGKVAHDARYNHVTQIYQSYINQGVNPQAALELTNQKIAEKGWTGWVSGDNKRYGDVNSFTDHTIDQFNRLYPDSLKSNNFNQFFQGIEGGRTKYNPAPNIYRQHLLQTRPGVKKRINEYRRLQGQSPLSLVSPTSTPLPWEESILYNPQLPLEVSTEQPVIAADGGCLFKGGGYIPSASIKRDIANFEGSSMKTNRSFEAEAKDFNKVIPLAIRNKLSQKQLDALYSYGYNVGMDNLKNRVLPTLTAYTQGKAGADDVAASMWASKDIYMRGLRRRRTYERNMFTGNSPVGTRESIVSRAINMDLSGLPTVVKFSGDTPKFQYDLFPPNPTNYGTPIDWSTPEKKVETPTIIPKEDNNGLGLLALINQIYDSPKQEPLATYTPQKDNNMFVVNALSSSKNDTLLDNMWFSKGDYLYNDRGSSLLFNNDKYLN